MPRELAAIAADLAALTASDFDDWNAEATGRERLDALCDELRTLADDPASAAVLFETMERLDDVELGTPGPIVHTLEGWRGIYEPLLVESVRRKPTSLSVWMVNRILNTSPPDALEWIALLEGAARNPAASAGVRAEAKAFFERVWLEPWQPITSGSDTAAAVEGELRREVGDGHPLYGLSVRALAAREDCDDVLFAIGDGSGRVSVVHLTWTSRPPEQPPWPSATIFTSFEAWVVLGMRADHDDFRGIG